MDKENTIKLMLKQHDDLQSHLVEIFKTLKEESIDSLKIIDILQLFKEKLSIHLELENNSFYPALLDSMSKRNSDTTKTKKFIIEMDSIEKDVVVFLKKFQTTSSIENNISKFKFEFNHLVNLLNMRIESEEDGVYLYWKTI